MDATGLFKEILKGVVIIGFIGVDGAAFLGSSDILAGQDS